MTDLRDQYQQVILDHTKRPRNFHALADASHVADGHNRLCGDKLRLFLRVEHGAIADVAFQGVGCALSTASASLMTEAVKGRGIDEVRQLFERFHSVVTGPPGEARSVQQEGEADALADLGKLVVFAGVRDYPVRVKCATLAWHTLQAALKRQPTPVSTE